MPRLTPTVRTSCRKRLTNSIRRFRLSCRPPKKNVKQQSARRRPRSKFSNRKPRPLQPEHPNDTTLAGLTATTISRLHSGEHNLESWSAGEGGEHSAKQG